MCIVGGGGGGGGHLVRISHSTGALIRGNTVTIGGHLQDEYFCALSLFFLQKLV